MKAAVVGMGPHGWRIADVITAMPGLELTAVVEARADAMRHRELPDGVAVYRSAAECWAAGGAELVCIATNGPSHAEFCLAAMQAGASHVMVEKPMGTSVEACDLMIAEAQCRGVRLSVDQSRRHDPFYRWLRDTIRSGRFGEPKAMWVQRPGVGLGCLATHSFDLVEFLLGVETQRVVAWVDEPVGENPRGQTFVDPGGTVVMDLGQGIRAIVAQIEDGAGPMSVEIDLTAARIRLDERSGEVEIIRRDLSVKPGPGRPPLYEPLDVPNGLTSQVNMSTMLRGVLEELVSDQEEMDCAAVYGKRAVEILVAAYLSEGRGNAPVDLPLTSNEHRSLCLPVT